MNTFSFQRTFWLIKKQLKEDQKQNLIILLACAGLLKITMVLMYFLSNDVEKEYFTYLRFIFNYGFMLFSIIIASFQFKEMRRKVAGNPDMILPVTHLEKLISAIVITFVISFLAYSVIFILLSYLSGYAANLSNIIFYGKSLSHNWINAANQFSTILFHPIQQKNFMIFLTGVFVSPAFFLFGAARFKETPFAYTMLTYVIYSITVGIICIVLAFKWVGDLPDYFVRMSAAYPSQINLLSNLIERIHIPTFMIFYPIVYILLFFMITYYTIKEKEV